MTLVWLSSCLITHSAFWSCSYLWGGIKQVFVFLMSRLVHLSVGQLPLFKQAMDFFLSLARLSVGIYISECNECKNWNIASSMFCVARAKPNRCTVLGANPGFCGNATVCGVKRGTCCLKEQLTEETRVHLWRNLINSGAVPLLLELHVIFRV